MPAPRNFIGMTFGRLGVYALSDRRGDRRFWKCVCVCGNESEVAGNNLGVSVFSCGCRQRENRIAQGKLNRKHGMRRTAEYAAWNSMWQRCTNPKSRVFKNYGGRGISIAPEWRAFETFFADLGPRPDGMELDRINNEGNYEPGNCRWTTRSENIKNTRAPERNASGQFTGRLVDGA